jgi:hypothetical protein
MYILYHTTNGLSIVKAKKLEVFSEKKTGVVAGHLPGSYGR